MGSAERVEPRLRLKRGIAPVWRDDTTAQVGLGETRARVLGDLTADTSKVLSCLDGRQTRDDIASTCGAAGESVLGLLVAGDLVEAAPPGRHPSWAALDDASQARAEGERAHLALRSPGDGRPEFAARRARRVLVRGAGRIGSTVAHLLAASGIGRVMVDDDARVAPADPCPGGVSPADVGLRRSAAATAVAVRALPPALDAGPADLVIFAEDGPNPPDPALWRPLLEGGTPFLPVNFRETTAIVGPLVLPARVAMTGCPHCVYLHRCDRDPQWPLIAPQLLDQRDRLGGAAPVALIWATAALVVTQGLGALGTEPPLGRRAAGSAAEAPLAAAGASLELDAGAWRWRRRWWGPHPACGCHTGASGPIGP